MSPHFRCHSGDPKMISRIIEAAEISEKIIFYEIRIEDVEFHILGQTVKTNKWLRFEEWQQIYEQLKKSFSTYSVTPPDFTIKSFTVGNYIRVEVELFPIENCFVDLFKMKLENCMPDFLQVRIKQIALGSSLQEIQETERKQEKLSAAILKRDKRMVNKQKKKRRSVSLSEYNPVMVNRSQKAKYVPPYKASKLSPDVNEADEPYSPKPVSVGEVGDKADYSPLTISASEIKSSVSTTVPMYKPSAIMCLETKALPEVVLTADSKEKFGSPCQSVETKDRPSWSHNRSKRNISPASFRNKRPKLSEDLFADSDVDETVEDSTKLDSETYTSSTRTSARKKVMLEEDGSKKLEIGISNSKGLVSMDKSEGKQYAKSSKVPERRSKRAPVKKVLENFEMCVDQLSRDSAKSSASSTLSAKAKKSKLNSKKDFKKKKPSQSKTMEVAKSQASGSSPKQLDDTLTIKSLPLQSIVELQHGQNEYEKQIEVLEELSKNLKEMIKPPPNVDIVDLNGMQVKELIATFGEFKSKLDKQFEKYKNQRRFPNTHESERLYLLILNIIDRDRVISMMDHLQSVYEPNCDGVPTYVDLFMNVMAPEWILRIFMKKINLSRGEAIDRIKQQRDIEAYNQSLSTGQ